jgi:membrane associated rhomboid family serine protease
MFAVVPLGVEGGQVRFPVVGLSILLACLALFGVTWLAEEDPLGNEPEIARPVVDYWAEHPYLELPEAFSRRFLNPAAKGPMDELKAQWAQGHRPPLRIELEFEQGELDRQAAEAVATARRTLFRQLALTPANGWLQPGWLTHLFLHAGWMHLIGNMLFLYAVSLLLEDAWGRGRFLAFYLLGGLVSGAAEFLMNRDSGMVLVGASGAVSACIGAAMVRFATRKMRVGYFIFLVFFLRTGTFSMPVWLWGVLKAGGEVFDLVTGSSPGVAVLAHVVGLGFGAAVALGMRWGGLDRELVATDEASSSLEPSYSQGVLDGTRLLAQGELAQARSHFEAARAASATDVDALWGLFELEVRERRPSAATPHLERVVQVLLSQRLPEQGRDYFVAGWKSLKPHDLRPGFALLVGKALGTLLPSAVALGVWLRAGAEPGPSAAFAKLNALELCLEAHDVTLGRTLASQLKGLGPLAPAMRERVEVAEARLAQLDEGPSDELEPVPPLAVSRQCFEASVTSARVDGLGLALRTGEARMVTMGELKAVGAGYVAGADLRRVLVAFLVLDWGGPGRPAVLVKLDSDTGGVERLRPHSPPKEVWLQFLPWLADKAGAVALPSRAQLASGALPFCADVSALEAALFS